MKIFVLMPSRLKRQSFILDHPYLDGRLLRFVTTKDDMQKVHGHADCQYITYLEGPDPDVVHRFMSYAKTHGFKQYVEQCSVICMNDGVVQAMIGFTEEQIKEELEVLAQAYYDAGGRWHHKTYGEYRNVCYWYVREIPMKRNA
jgi:hypothetical protein